ncbi:MAG: RecQ family ATP-dependent DNA helicase [Caldilineaceae bacterium]|nr:RecQ family ATP-dependent DNA helicase [Caldilineaceae bacterium]
MRDLLKDYFGHDNFLPMQEEIISIVLDGDDALVVMPTGGGKSLCYQLPALRFSGLTLVVAPLMALMQDQVESLLSKGISAAFVNSSLSRAESQSVQKRALDGELNLLYVTPERLLTTSFRRFLNRLEVSLVAVDEAHCISMWGHDFRKEYRKLGTLRRELPGVPFLALTATASEHVRRDIISELQQTNPRQFIESFNRPNLKYWVLPKKDERNDFARLKELLQRRKGETAIIYRSTKRSVEKLALSLNQDGFEALPYHGGLDWHRRSTTQHSFMSGSVPVIVATNAFGMGIDKPDIRLLVHYDFPMSLEGYYQETGRAGRDGSVADCVLFYSRSDRKTPDHFIREMKDASQRRNASRMLEQVLEFCELRECRRNYLLHYFDEPWNEDNCGSCDNCIKEMRQTSSLPIHKALAGLSGDLAVLLGLRDALAGDYPLNWKEEVEVHEWEGVRLDTSTHPPTIVELNLDCLGLTGVIPAELGSLTALKVLDLMENKLRGQIPFQLGNLVELETLFLSSNKLSGSIPEALGNLANLEDLLLGDNDLSGEIPLELGKLKKLKALMLDGNRFCGSIPSEMGNLTGLETLILENNLLSGSIPAELGKLTNLEVLYIAENQFRGCIPDSLAKAKDNDLDRLSLPFCSNVHQSVKNLGLSSDCTILLEIKDVLARSSTLNWNERVPVRDWEGIRVDKSTHETRVTEIRLGRKGLTGTIPGALGQLTDLNLLYLRDNELRGEIPAELGRLPNLKWLSLSGNQLTGPIPNELGKLVNLERLFLQDNELSGPIPPELGNLGNLGWLYLSHNALYGSIPSEFGDLLRLEWLYLSHNKLSGAIPSELEGLKRLKSMTLSQNRLTGCVPQGLQGINENDFAQLRLPICGRSAPTLQRGPSTEEESQRTGTLKRLIEKLQSWGPDD